MLEKGKVLMLALASAAIIGCSSLSRPAFSAAIQQPTPAQKGARVSVDIFYDGLKPYGDWFSMDRLGWVWMPYDVSVSWRPYSVGQWVYTDDGCTWQSDEAWGWATYHYGRWLYDASRGWVWVPGEEWAPAWVSWRYGGGYVGWAPLPPTIGWDDGSGLILGGVDIDEWIPPFWYSFVDERLFFREHVRDYIALSARNETLVRDTRNVTSYTAGDHRVFNRAIDVARIERDTGQTIKQYRIFDADSPQARSQTGLRDGQIAFYRPDVSRNTRGHAPSPLASNPTAEPSRQAVVTDDMLKQQDKERRELGQQQQANSDALKRQHQQELDNPPGGLSPDDIGRRHEAERRALEEQHTRERQLLNNWHSMGRVGGMGSGRPRR